MTKRTVIDAITGMLIMSVLAVPVYADTTDPVQSAEETTIDAYIPPDWEWDGVGGGEDCEDQDARVTVDPGETPTLSFEEYVDMADMEIETEPEKLQMQYLNVQLVDTESRNWSESNIIILLYRDGNHQEPVYLYRQSGYESRVQLPVGHYTVGDIRSIDGRYRFTPSEGNFDLTQDAAGTLDIYFGNAGTVTKLRDDVTTADPGQSREEIVREQQGRLSLGLILTITAAAFIMLAGGTYILWRRFGQDRTNGYSNDYMD